VVGVGRCSDWALLLGYNQGSRETGIKVTWKFLALAAWGIVVLFIELGRWREK
jgi:hypothetical protein